MKKLFARLISSIAVMVLIVPVAFAQTADGATPADESVCDALTADDVSPGLYGLCVAFCEAQDFANVDVLLTQSDLEELQNGLPSGRILDQYNELKQDGDPGMPCIVEAECPCWTQEELEGIDGADTDGTSFFCAAGPNVPPPPAFQWARQIVEGNPFHTAGAVNGSAATPPINVNFCLYINRGTNTERRVDTGAETAASCLAAVTARCDSLGL